MPRTAASVRQMGEEIQELFVRNVEVGVANLDMSTDDGVVSTRVVVQRTTADERETGQERELLLVYDTDTVPALADVLRTASERASADQTG